MRLCSDLLCAVDEEHNGNVRRKAYDLNTGASLMLTLAKHFAGTAGAAKHLNLSLVSNRSSGSSQVVLEELCSLIAMFSADTALAARSIRELRDSKSPSSSRQSSARDAYRCHTSSHPSTAEYLLRP